MRSLMLCMSVELDAGQPGEGTGSEAAAVIHETAVVPVLDDSRVPAGHGLRWPSTLCVLAPNDPCAGNSRVWLATLTCCELTLRNVSMPRQRRFLRKPLVYVTTFGRTGKV